MSKPSFTADAQFCAQLVAIARAAGAAILTIYNAPETANIQTKSDNSPLTAADLAAHQLIARELPLLLDVPMISEEAELPSLAERRQWSPFWLIDPLDGTKEFIARNGEFTVNIALVIAGEPLLGVVHVPVRDETYLGVAAALTATGEPQATKYTGETPVAALATRIMAERLSAKVPLDILVSHRHGSEEQQQLIAHLAQRWPAPLHPLSAGSSLKFCLIAEGRADCYPRLAPTSEWDTAAAQAVLCAAGGMVVNADTLQPLQYNQRESLLNPHFLALADAHFDWANLLGD